jgi:hypothetical protein
MVEKLVDAIRLERHHLAVDPGERHPRVPSTVSTSTVATP